MTELGTLTHSLTGENKCLKREVDFLHNQMKCLKDENDYLNAENGAHADVIRSLKCERSELARQLRDFERAHESAVGSMQSVREKLNKQDRARCMLQELGRRLDIQDVFYWWRGMWHASMCYSHSPQKLELQDAFGKWRGNWRSYPCGSMCHSHSPQKLELQDAFGQWRGNWR